MRLYTRWHCRQTHMNKKIALHGCTNSFPPMIVETSRSKNPEASHPQRCYRAASPHCLGTLPWVLLTPDLNFSHASHGSLHSCVPSFFVNTHLAICSHSSVKRELLHVSVYPSVISLPPLSSKLLHPKWTRCRVAVASQSLRPPSAHLCSTRLAGSF